MANQWYYIQQKQRIGPVTDQQLKQLATSGQLRPTDLVWKKGLENWVAAQKVKGLFPEPDVPLQAELVDGPLIITVDCGACGKKYRLDGEKYAGKKFQCTKCAQVISVPKTTVAHNQSALQEIGQPGPEAGDFFQGLFGADNSSPTSVSQSPQPGNSLRPVKTVPAMNASQYQTAAAQGDAAAQNNLGLCYLNGWGVPEDYVDAAEWFSRAAEQGHAEAQWNLFQCYSAGRGVAANPDKALRWLSKAAANGNAEAQFKLGSWYWTGEVVAENTEEALKWWRRAGEQGHLEAQWSLAGGVDSDGNSVLEQSERFKWTWRAAEQGHVLAQYNLGHLYHDGAGVPQDYAEAAKSFRLAAEQGYAPAQNSLGLCYQNGHGVPKDRNMAIKWYRLAVAQGEEYAQANLDECTGVATAKRVLGLAGALAGLALVGVAKVAGAAATVGRMECPNCHRPYNSMFSRNSSASGTNGGRCIGCGTILYFPHD